MKIYIDIDNTICSQDGGDYENAEPFPDRIEDYNKMYDLGNEITYYTARGTGTGIDWRELTEKQFKEWGVKYTHLLFGKHEYDFMICDKAIQPNPRR